MLNFLSLKASRECHYVLIWAVTDDFLKYILTTCV